jgi:arylsulfatase A-like enzyme
VFVGGFGERHSAWWFYAGFREIHDTGRGGNESAEEVSPTALDWIRRNARKDNWYLHVNFWDAHTPYRAPASFGNPFENAPLPSLYTPELVEKHRRLPGPHTAQEINMYDNHVDPRYPRAVGEIRDMGDLRRLVDGYDCGIAYMDQHIGQIFAALEEQGVWDDLAVIVSSDHGENMGELGIYAEHATADRGTCRIPMIVRWPGGVRGRVDEGLHYNLDLAPTLAELLGRERKAVWDGQSFAPTVTQGAACGREFLVLSQCAHVCQRSARWDRWLYMRTFHDGFHLFPAEMLYDLQADPFEQADLAAARPEIRARGERFLADWHARMMATMPEGYTEDPLQVVLAEGGPAHAPRSRLQPYCERLEATGRGEAAAELRRRHDGEP